MLSLKRNLRAKRKVGNWLDALLSKKYAVSESFIIEKFMEDLIEDDAEEIQQDLRDAYIRKRKDFILDNFLQTWAPTIHSYQGNEV